MGMLCQSVFAASNTPVSETNLSRLRVGEPPNTIDYGNGETGIIPDNGIVLYINGSIYGADIIIENDRTLVPLRFISENLGAQVGWDGAERKVTITDGNNKIELVIGNNRPTLNGKVIQIDAAPKIFNDYTYVPLRFIAESLNCKVDWFEGNTGYNGGGNVPPGGSYPIGNRQVVVSRYPSGAKPITKAEALNSLKEQLMIAYEKRFGVKFSPLDAMPNSTDEKETFRYSISHLSVLYENDRFYNVSFAWLFMVDKYTGTVFLFYNGMPQTITIFNPFTPGGMIGFAG
jgi:hypothetical protein